MIITVRKYMFLLSFLLTCFVVVVVVVVFKIVIFNDMVLTVRISAIVLVKNGMDHVMLEQETATALLHFKEIFVTWKSIGLEKLVRNYANY